MKEITIKKLAYLLNQAKNNNQPKPIFFLGAGASASGDIPLASKIVENILEKYSDSPFLEDLNEQEKSSYPKLMECLLPDQRNQLLKEYIDKAKINVTHIYLAQLLSEGYADYILTVNFDNLMLRALALYNIFPSTYDMAILKDLTTTKFKEKSVVYLHGQHHGLWLLNTPSEMEKVKDIIPRIFDSIKDKRPWIFIGYSGNDPIFEHIKNLGRFDNGLYWLAYKDNEPESNVVEFLKESNVNASILKGYDSDSFMIKLNEALNLPQPQILDKPFSSLKNMLNVITDIDDKDHFRGVKDRLDMARNNVGKAIKQFEDGDVNVVTKEELNIDIIKKEIIDIIISSKYNNDQVQKLEEKVKPLNNSILNELLGELYFNWGNTFDKQVDVEKKLNTDKSILLKAISKYKKSEQISPKNNILYLNWGLSIARLALCEESETKKEKLYSESIEKLKLSIKIFSYYYTYFCLGTVISNYANTQKG
jgi:tetratricopeptide (TPR) repeat protein